MVSYDYSRSTIEIATHDAERRMAYDNAFLRDCGIAPLPYLAFWVQYSNVHHKMVVGVNPVKKRPGLRVFTKETEVAEGQTPGWVLSKEVKVKREKVAK